MRQHSGDDGAPGAPPRVSVVVPVWNGERYLRESLDSILGQTFGSIEVLVVDDASTDRTEEIVRSYGQAVRYHRQPLKRGIYGNANDGIAMSRGEFVAIYHADDVYAPTIVEREVTFLDRYPQCGAVFSSMIMMDPSGAETGRLVLPPEVTGDRPLPYAVVLNAMLRHKNRFLMCPSSMVRASVYRAVGVYRNDEFLNTSDLDMWLRISREYPIGVLEQPLFRYRFGHGNSAQKYHQLRTEPERYFSIVDLHLQQGGLDVAAAEALSAHEAHRSEDALMRAIKAYVLDRLDESRRILHEVRPARIVRSRHVQRTRLMLIYLGLQLLVRLPRLPLVARAMSWRWAERRRLMRGPRPAFTNG